MIRQAIDSIFGLGNSSSFESYLRSLQLSGPGAPSETEAKRDYQALLRSRTGFRASGSWF